MRLFHLHTYSKLDRVDKIKEMIYMKKEHMSVAQQFSEERFTKIDIMKRRTSSAFLLNFLPDQHMRPHAHPNRELYLHVLEGHGTLLVDGEEEEIKQGEVIFCNPEEEIGFTNTSKENVVLYGVMTLMSK